MHPNAPRSSDPSDPSVWGRGRGSAGCPVAHHRAASPSDRSGGPDGVGRTDGGVRCAPAVGWVPRDLHRWTLACVGVLATALGVIGAILPGMPTTIFVIVAAWCFAKSCPVLEQKLLRNRLLGPSMEVIDGTRPFTRRARGTAIAMMSVSGGTSIALLHATDATPAWVLWTIFAALVVGAVMIVRFRPRGSG